MSAKAKFEPDDYYSGRPQLFARVTHANGRSFALTKFIFREAQPHEGADAIEAVLDGVEADPPNAANSLGIVYTKSAPVEMNELMQAFLDAAWKAGLRPSSIGHVDQVNEAMKTHIDDLRAIAFKSLGVKP